MEGKRFVISALLDIYGSALSDRQRDVLDLYYNDDLSLAEVADNTGITRQGVRDALKKGEAELFLLEEKLGFFEKTKRLRALSDGIRTVAERYDDSELKGLAAKLAAEF